ncbi:MAD2L1-binding protein [Octopus sinensis]|uniref:MAD2L1-binding protein n=1 Tax=Octopus sinensis TaxID=2607531 RepID=A0A6P7SHB5_9MOLL|nr:MAD2L1-binding protein [Octopus sinensis]
MACRSAVHPNSVVCDIPFKGIIDTEIRAYLLNELIKYILYEKSQMPEMFDQLKKHINVRGKNANPKSSNKNDRQAFLLYSSCEKLFGSIVANFQTNPQIQECAIILGSSALSPKEVFHITFPPADSSQHSQKPLSAKDCKRFLFLQIFAKDPFFSGSRLPCTNMHVLLLGPRQLKLTGFSAKPVYKPSKRGQHYYLNLLQDSDPDDDEVSFHPKHNYSHDLSGFEPLMPSKKDDSVLSDLHALNLLDDDDDSQIWYQANISVKGYHITMPKHL